MASRPHQATSHFCAAVVASAHGVRGHVKVKCFLEDPSTLKSFSPFTNEAADKTYKVEKVFSQDKDLLIISLEGVSDRNAAESLKGEKLMLSIEQLPKLSEGTFYHRDLIGLSVKSSGNKSLGEVQALYNFGAGDLLEVKISNDGLQMIPFTEAFVPEVNLKGGFLLLSAEGEMFLKGGNNVS